MAGLHPGMADAERLEAIVDELAARLTALPEASFTRRADAGEWTAAEVVGHMTEMLPYWARVATAVAREPGQSVGRSLDDPDRVGAVAPANDVPRAESLARLRHAAHEAAQAVRTLDAAQWESSGVRPNRGSITVGGLVSELMVEHAASHAHQALDAAGVVQAD